MEASPEERERTADEVRRDIETERAELARAVETLREEAKKATDVVTRLRENLPLVAAGAFGLGFFLAGGVGSTAKWFARRSREGREKARLGQYSLVDLD